MLVGADIRAAVLAVVAEHGGAWSGTVGELLALLPGLAADATRLAKRLAGAVDDLHAAGVTLERKRQAGTGRRLVVLRWLPVTLECSELAPATMGAEEPHPACHHAAITPAEATSQAEGVDAATLAGDDRPTCWRCSGLLWQAMVRAGRWQRPECEAR